MKNVLHGDNMKEKKTNIRSFRYSDRVAEILEASEGNTLNEKFENLVLFCNDELPMVKSELEMYKRWVEEEQDKYYLLSQSNRGIEGIIRDLEDTREELNAIVKKMEIQ